MNVKLFQRGTACPGYAAPEIRETDLSLQGVICESFTIPELGEENLDLNFDNNG